MFSNWFTSCVDDFKEAIQVSLNVQEAKEKKVLVREYRIKNVQSLDSRYTLPIQSIWEEKAWRLSLDKDKNETYKIVEGSSNHLVILLNKEDTLITVKNFIKRKWCMKFDNEDNLAGSIRGMINFNLLGKSLNDTTSITIYRQKEPNDHINNLIPLFKFDIVKR